MTRKRLLVANWKMNLTRDAASSLAGELRGAASGLRSSEIWIAPSFGALSIAGEEPPSSPLKFGAQNVHWAESGAFTGEVSVPMLRELGASFAIVGHSERRHVFGESDDLVIKRALGASKLGIDVIFCIGERLEERNLGRTHEVLERQLEGLFGEPPKGVIIAYEPVWAIGTGKVASESEISDAHSFVADLWTRRTGAEPPQILYGGSVTPENFASIAALPKVSGGLIGGASLKASSMQALIEISEKLG